MSFCAMKLYNKLKTNLIINYYPTNSRTCDKKIVLLIYIIYYKNIQGHFEGFVNYIFLYMHKHKRTIYFTFFLYINNSILRYIKKYNIYDCNLIAVINNILKCTN